MKFYSFKPIYQERLWGGRNLETLFQRELPAGKIGESWELVDRPEACSDVLSGPNIKSGERIHTLNTLWKERRKEIFGTRAPTLSRFPILIKLLDAQENLSVQVHPALGQAGEPKTEMWYFLETQPEAKIYTGLARGVTRASFEKAIGTPELAGQLSVLPTQSGETMFLPSGRVHAIGAGNVILEIQQNSDTTYRVDDWGRVDEQGRPRTLHKEEALASINFKDFTPQFAQPHGERLLECAYFTVQRSIVFPEEFRVWISDETSFQYHFLAQGEMTIDGHTFQRGDSWLVPAGAGDYELLPTEDGAELITVQWGR